MQHTVRRTALFAFASLLIGLMPPSVANSQSNQNAKVMNALHDEPLTFEANKGQARGDVQFVCRIAELTLLLKKNGVAIALPESETRRRSARDGDWASRRGTARFLEMRLARANPAATFTSEDKANGESNYFVGSRESDWVTGVPHYATVRYHKVYRDVDVVYYGNHRQLEYDLVVAPHGDAGVVRLEFAGQDGMQVSTAGDVVLRSGKQAVTLDKPAAYQVIDGARREVKAHFVRIGNHQIGFRVDKYDHNQPLVIDPELTYSTYLGGTDDEGIFGIGFDLEGNVYVAGETSSLNFPTRHAYESTVGGNYDAFVSKFDHSGSHLIYSTYLGGSMYDHAVGIAVDNQGSAYVAGLTNSPDFPVFHAFQNKLGGQYDAFVTRLSPSGSHLIYSTYLGGASFDAAGGIAIDAQGDAFIAGSTHSADFPTTAKGLQRVCDQGSIAGFCIGDGFITKLDASGSKLVFSTYLGGAGYDQASGIAVDDEGAAYIVGQTASNNFPTKGAFQASLAGFANAFVTKLDAAGERIVFSSYLGGNDFDGANVVVLDVFKNMYVAGSTSSTTFPTVHPFQAKLGGQTDAFVTKVHSNGATLDYSTYLGGAGLDYPLAIAVDALGAASVAGFTFSNDFPVKNAILPTFQGGISDAFITRLDKSGSQVNYSTYLGGSGDDFGYALNTEMTGAVWIGGSSSSTNFPQHRAFQPKYAGGPYDAFLSKISLAPADSLEVLKAAVDNLAILGVIEKQTAGGLIRHLERAREEVGAGDNEGAREDLVAFEGRLFELVENKDMPEASAIRLGLAVFDVLESLAGGMDR